MKLVSFNVNGIRDFYDFDADIFFIEESKFSEGEFPFLPDGYHCYFTISKVRKGYSGVTIYTKKEPISIHYGLKDNKYDDEGRVITLEFENFYYVGAYVPNSGDELKRLDFRMQYEDDLLEYLNELDARKPLIYTGDLNVAHQEIDLKNQESNHNNAGFTDQEREKFTRLLSNGYVDTFRKIYPDTIKYSWWSYRFSARVKNIGWRIDYFIVSNVLKEKIKDSKINDEIMGSDHCPIELDIQI